MINEFSDANPDINTFVVAWGNVKTTYDRRGAVPRKPKILVPDTRPTALLINHGSFNPVHLGHLQMMTDAKAGLEGLGYRIVQGFLELASQTRLRDKGAPRQ